MQTDDIIMTIIYVASVIEYCHLVNCYFKLKREYHYYKMRCVKLEQIIQEQSKCNS